MNARSTVLTALVLFAVLASLPLAGCAGYADPQIEISEAKALERTPDGVTIVFTLNAKNTNDVALPLRDVEYELEVDGRRVFQGTRSPEATLRRLGSQSFRLPAVIATSAGSGDAGMGAVRYRLSGTMRYVTPGQIAEALFDTGVRVPSVSFSGQGEVNLAEAPMLKESFIPLPIQDIRTTAPAGPTP